MSEQCGNRDLAQRARGDRSGLLVRSDKTQSCALGSRNAIPQVFQAAMLTSARYSCSWLTDLFYWEVLLCVVLLVLPPICRA